MIIYMDCVCGLSHPENSFKWQLNGHGHKFNCHQPECSHCHRTFRPDEPWKAGLDNLVNPPIPPPHTLPHAKATFDRAHSLIGGDRRDAYGNVEESFARVALVWSGILGNRTVTAKEVCLMMTGLKLCREANAARQDNVDDACGYLGLLAELNALEGLKKSNEAKY